ncbi:ABC transporter substrate-binding protein [Parasphaerochaeta coccoides]|uniref:Extracellular solute-binding protein family 1 n=1 Tax=Parasphaerochaeta coccoides (strain ATCC BAA-1237 / DSM 17374 / SPN1) TaxID=760011 RepID=F4GM12_PARC1|nr:extracellular solute-binding protein [Parasphaerochaeta coccoides]AEC02487.1 extracellular solute-binding protein family 1 [Parasphaerochaeta coccoides DSM 17374]
MKKFLACLLILTVAATMLFAGGGREKAAEAQPLKVMLSEEPATGDALVSTLQKWADETGNKLDIIIIPYEDQLTKFPLMAKNKDLPDLLATTRLTRLYPEEFIDLTEVLDISIFEPQALKIIGQDYKTNKNTTVPQQFTITTVFYNKDAFLRAGITPPSIAKPWTTEELYENAQLLVQKGGVKYGIAVDASRARYDNLMYINGGSMVIQDGDSFKVAINSPQNIEALEKFVMWNNTVMPKAIWAGGTTDNPGDYFKNGDVGIYFSGTWNYNSFYNQIKSFAWGIMPSPTGSAGPSAILGGSGLAIPNEGKQKTLAISFLKWFYEKPENFQYYLELDKGLSSLKGVSYSPSDPNVAADYAVMQAEVGKVADTFIVDESSMWRNFYDNEYRDALKQTVNGDITAEKALTDFARLLSIKSGWQMAY